MRTSLPDEHGWYWAKCLTDDAWFMAFVDTNREVIEFYPGHHGGLAELRISMDSIDEDEWHWYGPFNCPGGDFGGHTIIMEEKLHQKAEAEGKAICVTYADYDHCADEKHHCSLTITELRTRQEADELCRLNRKEPQRREPLDIDDFDPDFA